MPLLKRAPKKKRGPKISPDEEVRRWNVQHPIGTPVTVEMDSGELRTTMTRDVASVLSGHTAVIFVVGISGCYLLSRVKAIPPEGK